MRTTTNFALPYPESGEHTRTWEFWQGLAEAVDTLLASKFVYQKADGSMSLTFGGVTRPVPFAQAALRVTGSVTNATFAVAAFTFPASRFTQPPIVAVGGEAFPFATIVYGGVTATGSNIAWAHVDGTPTTATLTAQVHATQMTPTAGAG